MSYSPGEVFSVIWKRVKRIFTKKPDHMSLLDKLRLRFMRTEDINRYKIFGRYVKFPFEPYWFRHSFREIFEEEVYKFTATSTSPLILDCGSNIGLSIIYFKKHYPDARIISFEPDKKIFQLLKENISQFGEQSNIELRNEAVWTDNAVLSFQSTGSMGGSIQKESSGKENIIQVEAVRLKDFLNTKVDFLKIDIEGPEIEVLSDCSSVLHNVENIFVEYHCNKNEVQRLDSLLRILSDSGFRYYIRQAYENLVHPYVQKHGEYMDIQLNIFGFRSLS